MDAFLIRATHSLAYSEAIDASALRQLTPPTPGLVRECVIVALGIRGDATILPEYRRLMEQSIRPGVRLVAVEGFQKLAKPDDLELLDRTRTEHQDRGGDALSGGASQPRPPRSEWGFPSQNKWTAILAPSDAPCAATQNPSPNWVHSSLIGLTAFAANFVGHQAEKR